MNRWKSVFGLIVAFILMQSAANFRALASSDASVNPTTQASGATAALLDQKAQMESDLQRYADKEVADRFARSETDVLEHARRIEESGEQVLSATHSWIEVVTLLFVISFALFVGEFQGLHRAKVEARAAGQAALAATQNAQQAVVGASQAAASAEDGVRRIQKAELEIVEPAKQRMLQLQSSISQALEDVQQYIVGIEDFEQPAVVGEPSELPPVENVERMEEADIVILIAMRTGAIGLRDLAPAFVKLGKYWNYIENYPRAVARFQRAVELDSTSWEALLGISRSFCGLASRPAVAEEIKQGDLREAALWCRKAEQACSNPEPRVFLNWGWIAYGQGQIEAAIEWYTKAKAADPEIKRPTCIYNLSAAYAKTGNFSQALDELQLVVGRDRNWKYAARDPDFKALMEDQTAHGERFRELLEKAKREAEMGSN
jgi:tetratricopeptide (TPR) repeat protein